MLSPPHTSASSSHNGKSYLHQAKPTVSKVHEYQQQAVNQSQVGAPSASQTLFFSKMMEPPRKGNNLLLQDQNYLK